MVLSVEHARKGDDFVKRTATVAFEQGETVGPRDPSETKRYRTRRRLVLALNIVTVGVLLAGMAKLLSYGGWIWIEGLMLVAYAITLPWLSIGLWNSIIGLWLDRRFGKQAATYVTPALARARDADPITTRIAIIMPLRNEDPAPSLRHFQQLQIALDRTPWGGHFDYHVLSDTDKPEIALEEEAGIAHWRHISPDTPLSYRRRTDNAGYKAGNIAEFLDRHGSDYDFFLPLDADSVMGPDAVLRMVRVMQASPEIGILQSLVTGLPSRTFFTRAFQFGMRHGMRSYTLGSAWWLGDCGPNWGHNVLIRTAPFHAHCMLPKLRGTGPLSGYILSHDMLEAALMRRAGYEVRVIAAESDSYEENPPSLADFIRRELRWCNGNMQYLRLLNMKDLQPVSRLQLYLAIQMYAAAPAWIVFIALGALTAIVPTQFEAIPIVAGIAFFTLLMTLSLMPKLMGLAQVLSDGDRAARYGGRGRVIVGGLTEILFSMVTAPIVAFGLTMFMIGLCFGKRVGWDAQQRSRTRLHWGEATRVLWPQMLAGFVLFAWLSIHAPWSLPFAAPMLIALTAAIPIAVISTLPGLSKLSMSLGLFDIPEDRQQDDLLTNSALRSDVA